jgi:hypothetical protein
MARARVSRLALVMLVALSLAARAPASAASEARCAPTRPDAPDHHGATLARDAEGRYRYETDAPGRYPGRPLHVHVRVTAPGHRTLVTQVYPSPGQTSIEVDFVLVRE